MKNEEKHRVYHWNVTITQLRAFLAALDLGTFTAAAEEMDVTQASVSELIARLERELGQRLFTRGGRRLVPTAAAEELREHARQAVAAIDNGIGALRALTALEGGTCTFGVLRNAAYYHLSDLVARFHELHPQVRVRLVGINSALVAEAVATGELEAGLVVLPVAEEDLTFTPLFQDEVLFASAARPPAAGPVGIEEVCRAKLVLYDAHVGWKDPTRRQLRERALLTGRDVVPEIEVENVETALGLVAQGAAETIVSRALVREGALPAGVTAVPFDPPMYDTIALAQRRGAILTPATRRISELAESLLRKRVHEWGEAAVVSG